MKIEQEEEEKMFRCLLFAKLLYGFGVNGYGHVSTDSRYGEMGRLELS